MTIWTPRFLSVLRIVAALLFLEHGLMKLFHFPIAQPGVPDPLPPMLMTAGTIELVLGTLLILGLFTRVAAFLASGEMAAAYFLGHLPYGFWPGVNGGGEAILYCFLFFYIFLAGAGPLSIDALRTVSSESFGKQNGSGPDQ
ncbi:DoxX family protein [Altericroceibacterium spongiae]|nr:DoxX family protein [Altericroceibacterium spongiae]